MQRVQCGPVRGVATVLAAIDGGHPTVARGKDVVVVCGVCVLLHKRECTKHTVINVVGQCGEIGGCEMVDIEARERTTSLAEKQQLVLVQPLKRQDGFLIVNGAGN